MLSRAMRSGDDVLAPGRLVHLLQLGAEFLLGEGDVAFVIGAGGATVGALLQKLPPAYMWSMIGGAVVLSLAVGVVFGLYPAWKAANVDPIEALRS